jgi:cytoskeletal protein RodZ
MRLTKLIKDPFMLLIVAVVLVPALLVVFAITQQTDSRSAVNNVSQETPNSESTQSSSSAEASSPPQPITQAEQPTPVEVKQAVPESAPAPAVPTCDQSKKQAAESAKASQTAQESAQHERQLDRIRLISRVYRKYWDEEMARHHNILSQIEATYQAALAAANC